MSDAAHCSTESGTVRKQRINGHPLNNTKASLEGSMFELDIHITTQQSQPAIKSDAN